MSNREVLGAIKSAKIEGKPMYLYMAECAVKLEKEQLEHEKAKLMVGFFRQSNNSMNHVVRASQYDLRARELQLEADRLSLRNKELTLRENDARRAQELLLE